MTEHAALYNGNMLSLLGCSSYGDVLHRFMCETLTLIFVCCLFAIFFVL